jgi:6-phosphofructokinase 1
MLFVLGGDGTHAGANAIHEEVLHLIYLFCKCNISFLRAKTHYLLTHFIHAF